MIFLKLTNPLRCFRWGWYYETFSLPAINVETEEENTVKAWAFELHLGFFHVCAATFDVQSKPKLRTIKGGKGGTSEN